MKRTELEITNLHAETGGKVILRGVTLSVKTGERHIIMGPNGGGKSTLAMTVMGNPDYKITKGSINAGGVNLTKIPPNERAHAGIFLGFQNPAEIPGVSMSRFLRAAVNSGNNKPIEPIAFYEDFQAATAKIKLSDGIYRRAVNEGFSGGEKKKGELLQMMLLKPKYVILDEPDSGLDLDALKLAVKIISSSKAGMIIITHNPKILKYIKADQVHIMVQGKIVKSGEADLVKVIEKNGYERYQ